MYTTQHLTLLYVMTHIWNAAIFCRAIANDYLCKPSILSDSGV